MSTKWNGVVRVRPLHVGLSQRQPDTRHHTPLGDRLSNWLIHCLSNSHAAKIASNTTKFRTCIYNSSQISSQYITPDLFLPHGMNLVILITCNYLLLGWMSTTFFSPHPKGSHQYTCLKWLKIIILLMKYFKVFFDFMKRYSHEWNISFEIFHGSIAI